MFALLAAVAGAWGYQQHRRAADFEFVQRRTALLQEENTRLQSALANQQKESSRAYEISERKPIEDAVAKIRGLDFQQPVVYDVLTRAGIKKTISEKLAEQYSDEDFRNVATGYAALGLLEPDYPLKKEYIDLLGEQVAAFYDQHQHKLFMFEDASLHSTQNRIILAHELTHALQDQHFGLLKMPLEIKDNDDLAIATSALIEGDATVAMSDYMLQNFTLKSLRENLSGMFSQNMDQLQKAPLYLREMLIFPYLRGQEFCMVLRSRGGNEAVSAAFKDLPTSTSQILHPEKYLAQPRENPVRIAISDTAANGRKPVADNVLGEMGTRILLTQWGDSRTANDAASGWRGDRYLVFKEGTDTELLWKTLWNSPDSAGKFMDALLEAEAKRYGFKRGDWATGDDGSFSTHQKNRLILLFREGENAVILIDATNDLWKDSLRQKFATHGQN